MKRVWLVVAVLIVISTIAVAQASTIYDFTTSVELNNFEKVMIDENGNISALNTSIATVTVSNGLVLLKSLDGSHSAGIALPYQEDRVYAVRGSNVFMGVIANGTIVGSLEINGIGYVIYDGDKTPVLSDGEFQIKVISNDTVNKVVFYSKDGQIDAVGIGVTADLVKLAGEKIAEWSGQEEVVKTLQLKKGVMYRVTLVSSDHRWDLFIYKPSNSKYDKVSKDWLWYEAEDCADYKICKGSEDIVPDESGNYKFLIEFYGKGEEPPTFLSNMGYSEEKPQGNWKVVVEKLSEDDNPAGPIDDSNSTDKDSNNGKDRKNWWDNLDDKTKAILFGLGALLIGVGVISFANGRRRGGS
jgi:hypothetical protein